MPRIRCPECGSAYPAWTRQQLIEAGQRWADENGRAPYPNDWYASSPHHPTKNAVYRVFGSWRTFVEACGLKPTKKYWTTEEIEQAIFRWVYEHGRLPKKSDWANAGPGHPSGYTVSARFGSWNAGIVAAGYEPRGRGGQGRTKVGYQRQAGAVTRNAA